LPSHQQGSIIRPGGFGMIRLALPLILAAIAMAPARANDSSAELANGGLIFTHNDNVEMRSEDLYISADEVRVRYRFFNKSDKNVRVLVAFPMPEIRIEHQDSNLAVPTEDPVNLLGFTTTVNGKPVSSQVEQRAIAAGIDRTQYLRILRVPLAPHLPSTNQALDRLPRERWDDLVRLGLAEIEEYDAGKGMEKHLAARWALHTTFYREQVFPAGRETLIEHRYHPSVGMTACTMIGVQPGVTEPVPADYARKYCIDHDFLAAVERAKQAASSDSPPFFEQRIDYVLKTGANWSGPIKDFRLVVDKGDAANLVSFCGEGVKKIGPTRFEIRKTDYTPEGNFSVLILKHMPAQ
jgi:Domain of unknown function (DUF4424)